MSKPAKKFRKKHGKQFGMQMLEEKAMMAGDVAVNFGNGDVTITEAWDSIGDDQQVYVKQLNNGTATIYGQNGTTVNGLASINVPLTGSLEVDLGEGRDNFTMSSSNGASRLRDIEIDMGSGNARDFVSLNGVSTYRGVDIETGAGTDTVAINRAEVGIAGGRGFFYGDLNIDMGDDRDVLSINNTTVADHLDIEMTRSDSDVDNDLVTIGWSSARELDINLGGGDDDVNLYYNQIGDAHVDGDSGDDDVVAIGNDVYEFDFEGDSGVDRFYAYFSGGNDTNDINYLDLSSAVFAAYGDV